MSPGLCGGVTIATPGGSDKFPVQLVRSQSGSRNEALVERGLRVNTRNVASPQVSCNFLLHFLRRNGEPIEIDLAPSRSSSSDVLRDSNPVLGFQFLS